MNGARDYLVSLCKNDKNLGQMNARVGRSFVLIPIETFFLFLIDFNIAKAASFGWRPFCLNVLEFCVGPRGCVLIRPGETVVTDMSFSLTSSLMDSTILSSPDLAAL